MHGRLRAVALMVGLAALPIGASTTYADTCEMVGVNGSMVINDGSGQLRSWRINVDGVTYQSDVFDKLTKETRKKSVKNGKKKTVIRETVFTFRDVQGVTRTPNNDVTKVVDATVKGEVNENSDTGFVVVKDKSNNREFRIDDPTQGLPINCG